ncbi:MAG TPA: bifunctional demethylmenaquinone methyltransferase/2-methoxy-6-polyprenyl-1,4-benzoquinol methylase UbiE [Ghiorsea sp.]|nr:bifunctional demethylmenaquinone methyltransferase/2-methoxy-6-polyprenyl-1,4-benzoquinol methylase UbiE [Ghiorsea sp.]HIP07679.1 bifunctional demethylmenaquinone methyltransferase/2-methoxy-6-polyprenyl-1,4-benzoquinol methylase UbiE [Mariprofundaceae bacterium]
MTEQTSPTSLQQKDSTSKQTHFGFETVAADEKAGKVMEVFSSVAYKYDIMNDAMSMGMHRLWKRAFIAKAVLPKGGVALDVAAGSGDIAIGLLNKVNREARVVLTDLNGPMLQEGARRILDEGLLPATADCIQSDGTKLPFADNSFDLLTVAFGIRNFVDVPAGLSEFYRVLKPGGQFMCLEFSKPVIPLLDVVYDAYSFNVIPKMGEMITGDKDSYQYLVESIRRFPDQARFSKWINQAGFSLVRHDNLTGGVVAMHRGYKL